MKRLVSLCLILQIVLVSSLRVARADDGAKLLLPSELPQSAAGSEYVSGQYPGAVLITVNLWGSIAKPGIHHVPMRTDLVRLLSLAGGPSADAELDRITIKRKAGDREEVIRVDATDLLTKTGVQSPELENNDIILVPASRPSISSNTMATVGFISTILGVVLAGIAVSAAVKK